MATIVSVKKGIGGSAELCTDTGSFLHFRENYYSYSLDYYSYEANGCFPSILPFSIPDEVMLLAEEAGLAELRILRLLARAEQYRYGLYCKMTAKKMNKVAIDMALDYLELQGLLSDYRYASSWLRQKTRQAKIKCSPRDLYSKLINKGVKKDAVKSAISEILNYEKRNEIIKFQICAMQAKNVQHDDIRFYLLNLGWKICDVDDAFLDLE